MSEWPNEHDWKSCIRHKRIGGSNPPLSAKQNGTTFHGQCLLFIVAYGGFERASTASTRFEFLFIACGQTIDNRLLPRRDSNPIGLQFCGSKIAEQIPLTKKEHQKAFPIRDFRALEKTNESFVSLFFLSRKAHVFACKVQCATLLNFSAKINCSINWNLIIYVIYFSLPYTAI